MNYLANKIRIKKGYTLGELLIVVAIIVILFAVGVPAVFTIQKHLRQTELDNKAETVFVAVQNRLTKMKSNGYTEPFDKTANGVTQISTLPGDISEADDIKAGSLYYFDSENMQDEGDSAAKTVMVSDVMDSELMDNHWVIEYNPETAIVYAVFYSENKGDCADEYTDSSKFQLYNKELRISRSNRIADGARIGYYGGGSGKSSSTTAQLNPTATYTNEEKLTLSVSVPAPAGVSDYPVVCITMSDGEGNEYKKYYAFFGCSQEYISRIKEVAGSNEIDYELLKMSGTEYTLELVLDDLSNASTRFASLYPDLKAGSSLHIEVTALCPGNRLVKEGKADTINTNSLFADSSTNDTAHIEYARHLQNLDTLSGVTDKITNAQQDTDISFYDQDKKSGLEDWYETYSQNSFFNYKTADNDASFKPITNTNLKSYDGKNYTIKGLSERETKEAGLFASLTGGQTVKNLKMTGTKLLTTATSGSTAAGALAGRIEKGTEDVVIENCQAYLTDEERRDKDNRNVWIKAKYAGGLIGRAETGSSLKITQSAASTVIGNYTYTESDTESGKKKTSIESISTVSAGGLVGYADKNAKVTIEGSYADNYLVGRYTGGLVGRSEGSSVISGSYAAGYLTYSVWGAGMVLGQAEMDHSYTLMYLNYMSDDNKNPYYRTATTGMAKKVFFTAGNIGNSVDLGDTTLEGYTAALLKTELNTDGTAYFTDKTGNSAAYNLMGQALSKYTYPALEKVKHYGDWQADFQPGTLVYYEKYVNTKTNAVSYGFYGANVDSTLIDDPDYTVIGDGYGIVYKDNHPDSVKVKITDTKNAANTFEQEIKPKEVERYQVTVDDETFNVYPFDIEKVNNWSNPSTGFYLKAVLEAVSGSNTETAYYYFNPHFAKTVYQVEDEDEKAPEITGDTMISVRTARHLYMMSLYYDSYAAATESATYKQERNIDYAAYDWSGFSIRSDKDSHPSRQGPIAGNAVAFSATYNGGCNYITNVSIVTDSGKYVGLFGRNSGIIRNCILRADYDSVNNTGNYYVARTGTIQTNDIVFMGTLVGLNEASGRIGNCSTDGYYVAGKQATIFAYENSNLHAGGIAGQNRGTIEDSAADIPKIRVSSTFANIRLGGLTGSNTGTISNCYAIGSLEIAFSRGGSAVAAGFTAANTGLITDSYCAVALTSVGSSAKTYGFAPTGGKVQDCQYLDKCAFEYLGNNYSVDNDDQTAVSTAFEDLSVGSGDSGKAVHSYTFGQFSPSDDSYPFRAVVKNADGQKVHYGDWMTKINMGTVGFFYWEHETSGQNNGYHLTYIGESEMGDGIKTSFSGSTLCNSHSDGGVISEYGYGYFTEKDDPEEPVVSSAYIGGFEDSNIDTAACSAFEKQMSGYTFVAYVTKDPFDESSEGLILNTTDATRTQGSITVNDYTCNFTPFFANSMCCSNFTGADVTDRAGNTNSYDETAGSSANKYEIRSAAQLQYINWNNSTKKADEYLRKADGWFATDTGEDSASTKKTNVISFPYLGYAYASGNNTVLHHSAEYYWQQTHDIDADMPIDDTKLFTPIGSAYDSMQAFLNNKGAYIYTAFFNGTYVGDSYTIMNLQIDSPSQTVGLFGEAINARIDGVILYSDQDNIIQTNKDGKGFYSAGCLVGMALKGGNWLLNSNSKSNAGITNCSVSGYIFKDARGADGHGFGGANVGGLIGLCTVDITECSAVVDLSIEVKYSNDKRVIRVGGLVGSFRGSNLQNCYAGGSISKPCHDDKNNITHINVSGLANVGFLRVAGNLGNLFGTYYSYPAFSNCYVYTDLSSIDPDGDRVETVCPVVSNGNVENTDTSATGPGTHGTVSNCYYYSAADVKYKNRTIDVNNDPSGKLSNQYNQADVANYAMRITYDELSGEINLGKNALSGTAVKNSTYNNQKIDTALNAGSGSTWSWVTKTEGNNQPIPGKYSYPGSDLSLEGMNYPFPTVITQKDLVFGGTINAHYGSWPLKGSRWENGRDSMDIFTDMVTDGSDENGYAVKAFKLYIPKNVSGYKAPNVADFVVDTANDDARTDGEVLRAEVIAVRAAQTDTNGTYYPVSIKAYNTGTAKIIYVDEKNGYENASFSLEITANIYAVASMDAVELADKSQSFRLQAVSEVDKDGNAASTAKHFETNDNGDWVETVNQNNILSLNGTTISTNNKDSGTKSSITLKPADGQVSCTIKRAGLGDAIISSTFTYKYHDIMIWSKESSKYVTETDADNKAVPLTFTAAAYVEVSQPDMIGLSDSNSYNAAYINNGATGSVKGNERTYTIETPAVSSCDCFLYLRSDRLSLPGDGIQSVYVNGEAAELEDGEYVTGNENEAYHVSFDSYCVDDTYRYLPGNVFCRTTGDDISDRRNVPLRVVIRMKGIDYDLTVNMKKIRAEKIIQLTYTDTSSHSTSAILSTGSIVLPYEDDSRLASFVTPQFKQLTGWKNTETEEIFAPGASYNLTKNVTFQAVYDYITPVLDANGGMFDDYEDTLTITWSMFDDQDNGKFNIEPYSTGIKDDKTNLNHAVREGYRLIGWHTSPTLGDGESPAYAVDAVISLTDAKLKTSGYQLYAIWEKDE